MARTLCCLLVVASVAAGCGGPEGGAGTGSAAEIVKGAQRSLDDRKAGRIEFALTASAEDSDPVGFEIEGDYSFEGKGEGEGASELAVLDLTYRQVLGQESQETKIISDGEQAWVVVDGEATELRTEQAQRLELGDSGASTAVPAMDLEGWLRDGKVQESGRRATVTGEVNASALIADLQAIAAQVAGAPGGEVDDESADQIDRSVQASSMALVTEAGSLREVEVRVDFGAEVPTALREALGSYAGATLELSMTVNDLETPLRVQPPGQVDD